MCVVCVGDGSFAMRVVPMDAFFIYTNNNPDHRDIPHGKRTVPDAEIIP